MLKFLGRKIEASLSSVIPLSIARGTLSGATNASPIVLTATAHGLTPLNGTITAITKPTATTPIRVTSAAHGLSNGDRVCISGVVGMPVVNRTWTVQNATTNTFELRGTQGETCDAYASGGFWYKPQSIFVAGVTGNTAANGNFLIDLPSVNTITLRGTTGNGSYGGSPIWWTVPLGAEFATIQAQVGDVNYLLDGSDPTTGDGGGQHLNVNDSPLRIEASLFGNFRAINYAASPGAKLIIMFYREI